MLDQLGVVRLDHVAIATNNLEAQLQSYLLLPNTYLQKGPLINDAQGVKEAFVYVNGMTIEILEPLDKTSPIASAAERGGPVHFCWEVASLQQACEVAESIGCRPVKPPTPDPGFSGREVAFFYHPDWGVFELLNRQMGHTVQQEPSARPEKANSLTSQALLQLFKQHFPECNEAEITALSIDEYQAWDSIRQLQLIMDVEAKFGIEISVEQIPKLNSFQSFSQFLKIAPVKENLKE